MGWKNVQIVRKYAIIENVIHRIRLVIGAHEKILR